MEKHRYENKLYPRPAAPELVYVGEGRAVPGVPRRDLNAREVILYGGKFYLTRDGIFATPTEIAIDGGKDK